MQNQASISSIKNPIIIITAPSGAGKTSITHYLLKKYQQHNKAQITFFFGFYVLYFGNSFL